MPTPTTDGAIRCGGELLLAQQGFGASRRIGHAVQAPREEQVLARGERRVEQGGVADVPGGLTDQLKDGGRIACIFMEGALGEVRIGHKHDGKINWRMAFNAGAPVLKGFGRQVEFQL